VTTKTEWGVGIIGGLALVVVLLIAPPWMIIPVIGGLYVVYRFADAREKRKALPKP